LNTVLYLEKQLANIHALFHDIAGDLTEQEWGSRLAPDQNKVAYIVWHIPRTQDNFVHLWMRGIPEVFHSPRWAHWQALQPLGIGIGITLPQSDEIAATVNLSDTLAYEEAVYQEILTWLRQLNNDDLDQVPDVNVHLAAYPEYQTKGFREETDNLRGQPVWNHFMRPCIGHVHRHLGELELAKALLRSRQ
jgi:hypothetical protein